VILEICMMAVELCMIDVGLAYNVEFQMYFFGSYLFGSFAMQYLVLYSRTGTFAMCLDLALCCYAVF